VTRPQPPEPPMVGRIVRPLLLALISYLGAAQAATVSSHYLYDNVLRNSSVYNKHDIHVPMELQMSFTIQNVVEISSKQGFVHVVAVIRGWWNDQRLAYPEQYASPAGYLLVHNADLNFPSDVGITNGYDFKSISHAANQVAVKPNGDCYSSQMQEFKLKCSFDVREFPFDSNTCQIKMESWLHNDEWLKMSFRPSTVESLVLGTSQSFKLSDGGHYPVTSTYSSGEYTSLYWDLNLDRYPRFYCALIVWPSILLCFIIFSSTFIDPNAAPARVAVCITAMLTQAALRIPVAAYMPVVDYTTWLDTFQFWSFVWSTLGLIEYILVNFMIKRREKVVPCAAFLPRCFWDRTSVDDQMEIYADSKARPKFTAATTGVLEAQLPESQGPVSPGTGVSPLAERLSIPAVKSPRSQPRQRSHGATPDFAPIALSPERNFTAPLWLDAAAEASLDIGESTLPVHGGKADSESALGVGAGVGVEMAAADEPRVPVKVLTYRRLAVCTEYWLRWMWLVGYSTFLISVCATRNIYI